MSTIIGTIATDDYIIQSQRFKRERSGLQRLTEEWLCNLADVSTVFPDQGTVHPDFSDLFFQEYEATSTKLGLLKATVVYEGATFGGGGTSTTPFRYMTTGTQNVSILKHPDVDSWIYAEIDNGRDPRDAAGFFSAWKDGAVSTPGGDDLYGVDNFLSRTAVWNEEWVTSSEPDDTDMAQIGKIITPDGSPPTPTGSTWLCIEYSYRPISSTRFARTRRSLLSEAGRGWNTDIYS